MERRIKLFSAVFTTRTLMLIAIVLAAAVVMKWTGNHYDFSWGTALIQ